MSKKPETAYKNLGFLNSASARTLRILAEYLEPKSRLQRQKVKDTIVFFGSARFCDAETAGRRAAEANTADEVRQAKRLQASSRYYEEARRLASMLAKWSMNLSRDGRRFLVCSGGGGIMEAANRGASEAGDRSVGFNITLPQEQKPNPYITPELSFQFQYFFMRKLWFAYMAEVLIVFPGGYGTLDELMELLTLVQTQKIRKPILVVVYGSGYWEKLINFDVMEEAGTISASDRKLFHFADTPEQAFDLTTKWLSENYLEKPSQK